MSGTTYPDMVFGRIEHFIVQGTEDAPLILLVLVQWLREADVVRELEASFLAA
jgi:hypothetical protein